MKQIKLTPKEKAELKEIARFFLEATEIIDDVFLRAQVSAKILSRISCLSHRLFNKEAKE